MVDLPLEESQLVLDVEDGVPAVDDIIKVGAQVTCHNVCNLKRDLQDPHKSTIAPQDCTRSISIIISEQIFGKMVLPFPMLIHSHAACPINKLLFTWVVLLKNL